MNREALTQEINGQTLKLLEFYSKKDAILNNIEEEKKQLLEIEKQIRESSGVIQTLNFTLQTDGFANMPADAQKQPVSLPGQVIPKPPNKVNLGEGDSTPEK